MCGIVGLHGPQEDQWVDRMNVSVRHRGPDDSGTFRDRQAQLALAMCRLSIIDIAGGHQPMSTADGRYTIVFNGEIFNAPALRRELEASGVRFATDHSDTEVLLQLYAADGESCLRRLNGMFAFAVHDRDRQLLFCARDHAGIKPFFYLLQGGRFAFASELKALLQLPFTARELDRASLGHYMSLMYVPGTDTILRGIHRLPAGHSLTYRLKQQTVSVRRWYQPSFAPTTGRSREGLRREIRHSIEDAVRRWTLSDVPIACSLSGGLDSSSIVGVLAAAGSPPQTFSVGFSGPGEEAWNELPLARQVARKWGTQHHEIVLGPETLLDDLLRMVWHLDEPYGGGLPSWLVFKHMSASVKVCLTGTGGDELFGNYGKWRALERAPVWPLRRQEISAGAFSSDFHDRHYYMPDAAKSRWLTGPAPSTAALLYQHFIAGDASSIRDRTAATDFATQLPEEFLMMTDRLSMAHSLEARTPFLDRELIERVFAVPAADRMRRGDPKALLREAVADLLPPDVLRARKRGFVIPLRLWLRERLRPAVEHLLAPERLAKQGLLRPEFFDAFVRPHIEGRADHSSVVWAAFMLQLWHLVFVERAASGAPDFDLRALTE